MTCPRCQGLMGLWEVYDRHDRCRMWACIICGARLDRVIVRNRRNPPAGQRQHTSWILGFGKEGYLEGRPI